MVSESLLADQGEAVALAVSRTDHLHARVGHSQGAQVSDPRAPEWSGALDAHLSWWDAIVARHRAEGTDLGVTLEFGPPPYLPTLPFSGQPVADQWGLNLWLQQTLRRRWA